MPSQKLNNVEELLKRLETSDEDVDYRNPHENDVMEFIAFFGIEQGDFKVTTNLLYRIYRGWSKLKISSKSFLHTFSYYVIVEKGNAFLDKQAFKLTDEAYQYLLGAHNTNSLTRVPKVRQHFSAYLSHYKITSGTNWIEFQVLYYLYDKWAYKNKTKRPLAQKPFKRFLSDNFERKIVKNIYWYKVSDLSASITQKEIDEIRQGIAFREKTKSKK